VHRQHPVRGVPPVRQVRLARRFADRDHGEGGAPPHRCLEALLDAVSSGAGRPRDRVERGNGREAERARGESAEDVRVTEVRVQHVRLRLGQVRADEGPVGPAEQARSADAEGLDPCLLERSHGTAVVTQVAHPDLNPFANSGSCESWEQVLRSTRLD